MTFMRSYERKLREAIKVTLVAGVIVFCENSSVQPAEPYTAKGIIAQYCIKCHRATYLFEEPGALEEVVEEAAFWFRLHMGSLAYDKF